MKRMSIAIGGIGLLLLVGAGCPKKAAEVQVSVDNTASQEQVMEKKEETTVTPSVSVVDQAVADNMVVVAKITATAPSWIVIHADNNGAPGPVIGYTGLAAGDNLNIKVKLEMSKITPKLYAMLHEDTGEMGTYEFPEDDLPAKANETVVTVPFTVVLPATEVKLETKVDAMKKDTKAEASAGAKVDVKVNPAPTPAPKPAASVKSFNLTAKTWSFEPSTITVKKGDTVKLAIKSLDVPHGFALSSFGINKTLNPGETVNVEFVADKAGSFPFFCSVSCGSGHGGMRGTLVVEE